MKILHIFSLADAGQAANAITLIKEQQRRGCRTRAVADRTGASSFRLYEQALPEIGAFTIDKKSTLPPSLMQESFDFIHVHSPDLLVLAGQLCQKYRIPLAVTCHKFPRDKDAHNILSMARVIFCNSARLASQLPRHGPDIHIIPDCVDLEEYKPREKGEPLKITLVARLDNTKTESIRHLCKAINLLENIKFTVATNTALPGVNATFTGQTAYLPRILAASDIIIGTGRSTIEGLASGNAALVLGRTYRGLITPDSVQGEKNLDLSGLYGSQPCYKDIFYDLASLTENRNNLRRIQQFSRELAQKKYCSKKITDEICRIYSSHCN